MTGADVAALLSTGRFTLSRESETQAEIETFLAARLPLGCGLSREHWLSARDRPDFLIDGRTVVEVKVRGQSRREIARQVERYAAHDCVEAVVLATNVAMQARADGFAGIVGGKPLYVVHMGRGWL